MKSLFTAGIFSVVFLFNASAQEAGTGKADTISVSEVRSIIEVLSADSLKGRGLLNGGADIASDYIIGKFKEIGLVPGPGQTDFRQDFKLKRVTYTGYHARLDSEMVRVPNIIVASKQLSLDWNQDTPDIKVIFIGVKDDIRRKLEYVNRLKSDKLVVMDPILRPIFNRIGAGVQLEKYFIDSAYTPRDPYSTVFLLTDVYEFNEFEVKAQSKTEEIAAHNIIGVLPGKSRQDEYVIFSSHYDGLGYIPADKGDTIANGADDGGSSTTALLTLAKHFREKDENERSIMFVAFSAQKAGGVGSEYFSATIDPQKIVAAVNMDVIGKASQFGPESAYITGYKKSTLPEIIRDNAPRKFKFRPDPYREADLFRQSDNFPLAQLGIPAHTISTFQLGADPYYNGARDDIHTILAYIDNLTSIINAIAVSTHPIISGEVTPTRIDPEDI
ncbi:peptidase M28-like protein [Anseongella ginsenosidimutans]|uniref:Peptidase M28-like protein n=1 Tax=Anseongella ginsenosidimutans TaxID=496056 RepID=A0A4R3KYQ1_9SPHI|nr:M28 family peptidase [Anseongella ginsenosidimutans]QEC51756.1 M28 family peptidase [Anseongella ginsenosidimutans]TCS89122.1 peptidase M28-like protein [Anseongella ginsenosidimutans]